MTASALDLSLQVRRREVSSEELTRACLARIDRVDPSLHAFVEVFHRRALAAAKAADRRVAKGDGPLPPFHGVPLGVKDAVFVRGAFTRVGSRALTWLWSPVDDRAVSALRGGGFVIVGKLATSELGAMPVTEPDTHPPTRNPWKEGVTPGGSSGGSAAAVAAGLIPIAQGSDGAGSIRIPAALCGLYGFKPSRGRVPPNVGRADPRGLAVVGPITHTVKDAHAMLEVLAGERIDVRPHHEPLNVRIGLSSSLCTVDPELVAAVHRVAAAIEALGHRVVGELPRLEGELDEFLPLWQRAIGGAPIPFPSRLQPVTRWLYDAGKQLPRGAFEAAHDLLAARVLAWFGDADIVITPTVAVRPPQIGAWKSLAPREAFAKAAELGAFTAPFNITGQPAASIPVGVATWGVPIGVQLAGRPGGDAVVLGLSRALEQALPWDGLRAPGAE